MTRFSFVAQSLDNNGPNSIQIASEFGLYDGATLMTSINGLTVRGPAWTAPDGRTRVFLHDDLAVLELPLAEVDEAGRRSYVLCYGRFGGTDRLADARVLVTELQDFARANDRALVADHEPLVLDSLDSAWRQGWKSRLRPSGEWFRKAVNIADELWRTYDVISEIRPQDRRLVLFVSPADVVHLRSDRHSRRLLADPGVTVVNLPLSPYFLDQPFIGRILQRDSPRRGDLLVQSPLDSDEYLEPETAAERIAIRKMLLTVQLCQQLGATAVTITEISRRTGSSTDTWQVDESVKRMVSISASATTSTTDAVVDRITVAHRFPGQTPDEDTARAHLARHGLDADPHLVALLDMRVAGNPLVEQTLEITTRTELERTTAWLGRATVPKAGMGGRVDRALKDFREYTFTLVSKF